MFYKRLFAVTFILIFTAFFISCESPVPKNAEREILSGFSVHFLDVGQGDAILIKFPENKNVLIDCAEPTEKNKDYLIKYLNDYSVNTIDYFIITHPDTDHIGNAPLILNNFTVKELYLSDLNKNASQYFPIYCQVKSVAEEKGITLKMIDNFKIIKGEEFYFAFLTPYNKTHQNSSYIDVNGAILPDSSEINNISPIIYMEYSGFRFVFTGDAGSSQEKLAIKVPFEPDFKNNFNYYGINPNLYDVDFLKIGHHGSESSSCKDFLDVLKPKNAVISLDGNNYYGLPSSKVLERIFDSNPDCKLYRTDVCGTISVGIKNGKLITVTDLEE
ncbi:MAG: MBL fold metallo-hydrolase [Clostridiales bacterium]|nr:MBL fold metallo-hydrolase [Clostridiales bacterium]